MFDVNVIKPCVTITYSIWLNHTYFYRIKSNCDILGAEKTLLTLNSFLYRIFQGLFKHLYSIIILSFFVNNKWSKSICMGCVYSRINYCVRLHCICIIYYSFLLVVYWIGSSIAFLPNDHYSYKQNKYHIVCLEIIIALNNGAYAIFIM